MQLFNPVQWQLSGLTELSTDRWYLLISNHKSWLDIPVLSQFAFRTDPGAEVLFKTRAKMGAFYRLGILGAGYAFYEKIQPGANPPQPGAAGAGY